MRVLAATGDDEYRKPRIGMFDILEEIYADRGMEIGKCGMQPHGCEIS